MRYRTSNDLWTDVEIVGSGLEEMNESVLGSGYTILEVKEINQTVANISDLMSSDPGGGTGEGEDEALEIVKMVFKIIFMSTVIALAIVGNGLVILSVFKFPKLQITANSFIVSLAFADMLVALLVMPFNASQAITGQWKFGTLICDIFNANDVLFSTASLLHLCCISMDRYIAIIDPFHYEQKMTRRRVAMMLLTAWGASALISHGPIHTGWYTTEEQKNLLSPDDITKCTFVVNKYYAIISSTISFWIPTVIMVFVYAKIYREASRQAKAIEKMTRISGSSLEHLNRIQQNPPGTPNGCAAGGDPGSPSRVMDTLPHDRRKMKREHKAAKTLGIIMGVFLFCWLPFFIVYITANICEVCRPPELVVDGLFWIGYINSAVNPIIYAFFNQDFKAAFKKLLCVHKCADMYRRCRGRRNVPYAAEMYVTTSVR